MFIDRELSERKWVGRDLQGLLRKTLPELPCQHSPPHRCRMRAPAGKRCHVGQPAPPPRKGGGREAGGLPGGVRNRQRHAPIGQGRENEYLWDGVTGTIDCGQKS